MRPVHVRMYGRVDLLANGQRCLIPTGAAIELLVLLTAWPGTVVVEGALEHQLHGVPAHSTENEVRRHITALRRSVSAVASGISDDWVHRVSGGYAVDPDFVSSDLVETRQFLDGTGDELSATWWTEPLPNLPDEPFMHVRASLDAAALELAGITLEEPEELSTYDIEQLLELLARHPTRADLWQQLIDAAKASGDDVAVANIRMELQVMQGAGQPTAADLLDYLA